jgi:hypothetical protein
VPTLPSSVSLPAPPTMDVVAIVASQAVARVIAGDLVVAEAPFASSMSTSKAIAHIADCSDAVAVFLVPMELKVPSRRSMT